MIPRAEHSPYHIQHPLARDLQYYLVDGVPVLGEEDDTE